MTSPSSSPSTSPARMRRPRRSWARRVERLCCSVVTYFPLVFVYGLTTWAVLVIANMGLRADTRGWRNTIFAALGIGLFVLLNWSYTTAVFTDPGSSLSSTESAYAQLPSGESDEVSYTVKSTGERRFCKKCQATKPDRTHHCSTCKKCVLKMDHHCPWLATCVGLKNYKAFLLFLVYTSLFCWISFGMTAAWLWIEMFSHSQYTESLTPINYVLLCVISGIIGLVLTGFTAWHVYLACSGQTTIERLEKTRYLTPLRNTMNRQLSRTGQEAQEPGFARQLAEIHANAIPGVTRSEEGEATDNGIDLELGGGANNHTYAEMEHERERQRYEDYLDEQDSEKLPHAFDLGRRRNVLHVLGPDPLLWFVPVCNTTGDGFRWEHSQRWVEAREALNKERERRAFANAHYGGGAMQYPSHGYQSSSGYERNFLEVNGNASHSDWPDPNEADAARLPTSSSHVSLKTLYRRNSFSDCSGDEEDENAG